MNPDKITPIPEDECDWGIGAESENSNLEGDDVVPEGEGEEGA